MDNEKPINTEEQTLQDLMDRAWACDAESDEYLQICDKIIKMRAGLNEKQKIENQKEIEFEKLKIEREKMERDRNWLDPKFLIPVVVPLAFGLLDTFYRSWFTANMLRDVSEMEKDMIVTSGTPGKWVVRSVQDWFTPRKRV